MSCSWLQPGRKHSENREPKPTKRGKVCDYRVADGYFLAWEAPVG